MRVRVAFHVGGHWASGAQTNGQDHIFEKRLTGSVGEPAGGIFLDYHEREGDGVSRAAWILYKKMTIWRHQWHLLQFMCALVLNYFLFCSSAFGYKCHAAIHEIFFVKFPYYTFLFRVAVMSCDFGHVWCHIQISPIGIQSIFGSIGTH